MIGAYIGRLLAVTQDTYVYIHCERRQIVELIILFFVCDILDSDDPSFS